MTTEKNTMHLVTLALLLAAGTAAAAPARFTIDPDHTYPSFAADHMGLSTWRGRFDHSAGSITLDRTKQTGSVHIVTQVASIDFGNPSLTQMVLRDAIPADLCKTQCAFFDAAKYPTAVYDGRLADFVDDAPTRVIGKLTLHGVTRPLDLKIEHFKCIPDPMLHPRERCGAEASATFNRADFGIDAGKSFGFDMKVSMQIQVEAVQDKP
ncbi:MAG: Protein yceI precursor [Rhodanobacteraceae bacterium]|jgi:polyisoprenoid-binding protein YceI|nr:MAG: Protein yceI precursor [Rhodanobacteraceae bacterium]